MDNELFNENGTYILTDEEGKESEFELIGKGEVDETVLIYEYSENGDEVELTLIEDDDEFEKVSAYFDETLIPEFDMDELPEENG